MANEPKLSYQFINAVSRSPTVQAGLAIAADRIKKRADGIAAAEGVEMNVVLRPGVRPGGRAYVDVVADNAEQEFGSSEFRRLRILGRAGAKG